MTPDIADEEVISHRLKVDPVGVIAEILSNLADARDGIRELLSNSAAKQVHAKHINIKVYESDEGLAFTVEDDGCGMNYTGDGNGRLDLFLNIAKSKQSGYGSDEFGAKGLGTILLYNSRQVKIQTWDGGKYSYRVTMQNPKGSILDDKKLLSPIVYQTLAEIDPLLKRGAKVSVLGWDDKNALPKEFIINKLERYLYYHTVVGYTLPTETRSTPLPEVHLSVRGESKTLKAGFPHILEDEHTDDLKTVIFGPVKIVKKTPKKKTVEIMLRGGVTTETSKFNLTDETGGVWLSVNGIPYFRLYTNKYAKKLGLTDDFIRFAVECADVRLNMGRSDFNKDDCYDAFEDALDDAFSQIKDDPRFQKFYAYRHKEIRIKIQQYMTKKKEEFLSPDKQFVWYKESQLIAEPESEYDVAALLWILEGLKGLPFEHFRTLQYPGYRKGIDLLVEIQEEPESEKQLCVYSELERFFSTFLKHKHDPRQMSLVICWKNDGLRGKPGSLEKTSKPYKFLYRISDTIIPVYEISSFPDIFVGTRREAKEMNKRTDEKK